MLQAGLMMDRPLLISDVIEHAAGQFGDTAIVSREADGSVFRYSYLQCRLRALKLANALAECGMSAGAMAHPAVAMAAVVGVKHPKWQERPLLFIVRKLDQSLEGEEILVFLAERVAKWWIPDEVIFLDALPVGGTGKVQKALLREQYANHFS